MSDYERALRNAIREVFPECQLIGCWFHYCLAIRKHALKIAGFKEKISTDEAAKKLFHKFLAIALVKVDLIPAATALLIEESLMHGPPFEMFVEYFQRQWIRTETPASFCVFMMKSRTNNHVESFNSR